MKQVFEKMRARLRVQKKITSNDGFGGREEKWEDGGHVWGSLSAKEVTEGRIVYRLTLRPIPTLDLPARFHTHTGQIFQSFGPLIPSETGAYSTLYVCEL